MQIDIRSANCQKTIFFMFSSWHEFVDIILPAYVRDCKDISPRKTMLLLIQGVATQILPSYQLIELPVESNILKLYDQ